MMQVLRFRPGPACWQPEASETLERNDSLGPIPRACALGRNRTDLRDEGSRARLGQPGHGRRDMPQYWLPGFPEGRSIVPFPRVPDVHHGRISAAAMQNNPPDLAPCRSEDSPRLPTCIVSKADCRGCEQHSREAGPRCKGAVVRPVAARWYNPALRFHGTMCNYGRWPPPNCPPMRERASKESPGSLISARSAS